MKINNAKFLHVIDATPLVSSDLLIEDAGGRVLLGKHNKRAELV